MSINSLDENEWQLITQALLDGEGYPKSEETQKQLGFSTREIRKLLNELMKNHGVGFTNKEKQMILNCLDGAINYVDIDIPSLYDISEVELKKFKENLEKKWGICSTYGKSNKN